MRTTGRQDQVNQGDQGDQGDQGEFGEVGPARNASDSDAGGEKRPETEAGMGMGESR
jgi:hypothetical protein